MLEKGLSPIADQHTQLFILGSLPGKRSLEKQQYYAHWTNQFWKLVSEVIGEDLAGLEYDQRLALLAKHRIGLWDVISAARREGSADDAIHDATHNPIGGLRAAYPRLQAVAFNGGLAAQDGFRLLAGVDGLRLIALPSSSGRSVTPFAEKARVWMELRQFVAP